VEHDTREENKNAQLVVVISNTNKENNFIHTSMRITTHIK